MKTRISTIGLTALLLLASASTASAQVFVDQNGQQQGYAATPADDVSGFRAGVLLGGGFLLNSMDGAPNAQGFGLGAQGSYTFVGGLSLGLNVLWFLGESVDLGGTDVRFNSLQLTLDLGFDIGITPQFVLRPLVGLGLNRYHASADGFSSNSDAGFLVAPGVEAFFDITDLVYLGGLVRVPIALMGEENSLSEGGTDIGLQIAVTGGVRF